MFFFNESNRCHIVLGIYFDLFDLTLIFEKCIQFFILVELFRNVVHVYTVSTLGTLNMGLRLLNWLWIVCWKWLGCYCLGCRGNVLPCSWRRRRRQKHPTSKDRRCLKYWLTFRFLFLVRFDDFVRLTAWLIDFFLFFVGVLV